MNVCANFNCNKPAYKKVTLSNGIRQDRCKECYTRRIAATRAAKEKK